MDYKSLKQGNYWVVNKAVAKVIGVEAALFLSDIIDKYDYHKDRNKCVIRNNVNYFYYTSKDIEENTTLNYNSQKKCIKVLEEYGLIESRLIGTPAKLHFTILENKFCDFLKTCIAKNEKLYNKNKDIKIKHNTSLVESDAELFDDDDDNANIKDTSYTPKCNKVVTKKKNIDKSQFRLYDEVCSYFDEKVRSDKWLSVYDKLIRIDGYTEERILEIVKEFRRVGNWWRDSNNFISLAKLRKENDENVLYIHVFDSKMPKKAPEPIVNVPTQQPQSTEITDF